MNGYDGFFLQMNDEEWESFAVDVLYNAGFEILTMPSFGADGGKDFIVGLNNRKYIVSCKHYLGSGNHVGISDESDITDRIIQHQTSGFIGFYSTGITAKLQERLNGIKDYGGYEYYIFDKSVISSIIQKMDSKVLFKYGILKSLYYLNVSPVEYKQLNCMCCGKDILLDQNIPGSLAALAEYDDGTIGFIYGCKRCFIGVNFYLEMFLEIEQSLHLEQLLGWDELLEELLRDDEIELKADFWERKNEFEKRIRQRIYPQNYGTWYGL